MGKKNKLITTPYTKRVSRIPVEETLNNSLGEVYGQRFFKYRKDFFNTLEAKNNKSYPDFPISVVLELQNRCNLNCIMCHGELREGPKQTINKKNIEKLMIEFKEFELSSLMLGNGDEPLLYKDFMQVFIQAKEAGVMDNFLFTNGTLFTAKICNDLVKNQISRVMISVDAALPETYDKIRLGNNNIIKKEVNRLSRVERNIHMLVETKRSHNSVLPLIRVSFVILEQNANEIDLFVEKWKDIVDFIDFQTYCNYENVSKISLLNEEKRFQRGKIGELGKQYCYQPWNVLSIWANGNVSPCCSLNGVNLVVGNIHEMSLKEIWDSERMNELRQQIRSGELNIVCHTCFKTRDFEGFDRVKQ